MRTRVRLLLITLFFFVGETNVSISQTIDPATQAQLIELNITQSSSLAHQFEEVGIYTKILNIQKKISEAKENFAWAKNFKSIVRLKGLLEQMVCLTREMEFYVGLKDDFGCIGNIEYEMALVNFQASMDFIGVAIGVGVLSMSSGERISTIDDAIARLEKAINLIKKFTINQNLGIMKTLNSGWGKQQINPRFDLGRR